MDIIKRLQLNKNPKDIKSGSIVGAKNIMLDPISSFVTNEYGFKSAYNTPDNFKIVGCIPCNEEICIFLYNDTPNTSSYKESRVYRLKDNSSYATQIYCNWKWEGGKIVGTFAYNYKGELILAVSEYDTDHDVPLKVWNVDRDEYVDTNVNLPKYTCNYNIESEGNLVCGTYKFFIRFKLSENQYTTWFELTDEIYILDLISKQKVSHKFKSTNYDSANTYSLREAEIESFNNFFINSDLKSENNILLNLKVFGDLEYQIGYIIKRDTEILGRIFNTYKANNETQIINISDNNFIEEIDINSFLEQQNNFYNVKNLINYNNRLYISNYKESKTEDLSSFISNISYKLNAVKTNDTFILRNKIITPSSVFYKDSSRTGTVKGISKFGSCYIKGFNLIYFGSIVSPIYFKDNKYYILDKESFIIEFLYTFFINDIKLDFNSNDNISRYNTFTSLALPDKLDQVNYTYGFFISNVNNSLLNCACIWSNNKYNAEFFKVQDYDLYVENNNLYYKKGTTIINLSNCYIYVIQSKLSNNVPVYLNLSSTPYSDQRGVWSYLPLNQNTLMDLKVQIENDSSDEGFVSFNSIYNNNRTLLPGNIYCFYIHFIRKDLSYTNGFKLNNNSVENEYFIVIEGNNYKFVKEDNHLFKIPYIQDGIDDILLFPEFTINNVEELKNKGYIGYFISYENIKDSVDYYIAIGEQKITNTNIIYNNNYNLYKIIELINGKQKKEIEASLVYNKSFKENNIDLSINGVLYKGHIYISENNNINYLESYYKTLFRLTNNIFFDIENVDSKYMYLPGFYNLEKIVDFNKELIIFAGSEFVTNPKGYTEKEYLLKGYFIKNYSRLPLNAYSLKQDYIIDNLILTDIKEGSNVKDIKVQNILLEPSKVSDFLELKQAYKSNPILSYTNFNENTQDEFNRTIYRSDIISDESLNNGFRHFNIENYKNILENKGDIVNIVGFGLYMLVHTEYSLFVFDRNNQLTSDAQLQIPDTFDIDYKELTPSGEGFGGLKDKDECILTKHGYIWFDRISKSIFIYDGKTIKPLSGDIHTLLNNLYNVHYNIRESSPLTIRFAEDTISNRLIITIKDIARNYITLSYNFDTASFISFHDYTFDKNYKTYNKSYIFSEDCPTKLFVYNNNFDEDTEVEEYNELNTGKSLIEEVKYDDKLCSYIDIIFTDLYETPKTLNSISYILHKTDFYAVPNIINQYFNKDFDKRKHFADNLLYSGYKLFITTDLTFSGELDISQEGADVNKLNSTKPVWNNGIWNFNNFRENLNKEVTNKELDLQNVNEQMREAYKKTEEIYNKSDMRSLIHGKYFVLRFVFERTFDNRNLKFETVDVNISKS